MSVARRRRPTPPGYYIRQDILENFRLTQGELADLLKTDRIAINQLVKGGRSVSADMALRLSKLTGTTPQFWLCLQQNVDLWDAEEKDGEKEASILDSIKPL